MTAPQSPQDGRGDVLTARQVREVLQVGANALTRYIAFDGLPALEKEETA